MTKREFINEVEKIYFDYDCKTVSEAIEVTKKKLGISKQQFIQWFGR